MESAERTVKTRERKYSPDSKNQRNEIQEMKYNPEPTRGSGLFNYAKADIRNPLRYSVKRFFYPCCIP